MLKFYFPWIIHRPHDGGPKHRWLCVRFNGINWIFEKIEKKKLDRTKSTQTRKFYWIQRRHIFGFSQLLLIFNWLRLHFIFNFPFQNIHFNRYDYLFCWFFPFFFCSLIFLYSTTVAEVVRQLYLSARLTIESSCLLHFNQTIEKTKETKRFWGKLTIRLPFVF